MRRAVAAAISISAGVMVVDAIARIRRLLPDVLYFPTLDELIPELPRITSVKLKEAVKAPSVMAGYSGTPLPKKLGIKCAPL